MQIKSIFIILVALTQTSHASVKVLVYQNSKTISFVFENTEKKGRAFRCKLSESQLEDIFKTTMPTYFISTRVQMNLMTGPKGQTLDINSIKTIQVPQEYWIDWEILPVSEKSGNLEKKIAQCRVHSGTNNLIVGFWFNPEVVAEPVLELPVELPERIEAFEMTFGKESTSIQDNSTLEEEEDNRLI